MPRILDIASPGARLCISADRLLVSSENHNTACSLDDLDALIIANPAVALSGCVLAALAKHRIPFVCCDEKYLPVCTSMPVFRNGSALDDILDAQIQAPIPLKKNLWKSLIQAKIRAHSAVLQKYLHSDALAHLPKLVKSGDSTNVESRAAAIYWRNLNLFPKRDRSANNLNILFNYVYAIIYSATARFLCAAGMHPRLAIHHHNQYNPFSLASDIMEPFRAHADSVVLNLLKSKAISDLSPNSRKQLIADLFSLRIRIDNHNSSLFDALRITVFSVKKCLLEKNPLMLLLPDTEV